MENKTNCRMFAFESKCKHTMQDKPVFDYQHDRATANKAFAEKNRKAKESNKLDKNLLFSDATAEQLHQLAHIAVYMALQAKAHFGEDTLYRAFPIACKAPWTNSDSETVYDYIEDCFLYYMESQASGKYNGMTIYQTEEIQKGTRMYHYGPYYDGKKLVYRALYQTSKHQTEIDTDAQDAIAGVKHLASEEEYNKAIVRYDIATFMTCVDEETALLLKLKEEGKTQTEIADALNMTQKTVSKKLAKLRKLYSEGTEEHYSEEHKNAALYLKQLKEAKKERSLNDLPDSLPTCETVSLDHPIAQTIRQNASGKWIDVASESKLTLWGSVRRAYYDAGYQYITLDDGTTEQLDYHDSTTDDRDNQFEYVYKSKREGLASRTW